MEPPARWWSSTTSYLDDIHHCGDSKSCAGPSRLRSHWSWQHWITVWPAMTLACQRLQGVGPLSFSACCWWLKILRLATCYIFQMNPIYLFWGSFHTLLPLQNIMLLPHHMYTLLLTPMGYANTLAPPNIHLPSLRVGQKVQYLSPRRRKKSFSSKSH